jgi:hypothetical protein
MLKFSLLRISYRIKPAAAHLQRRSRYILVAMLSCLCIPVSAQTAPVTYIGGFSGLIVISNVGGARGSEVEGAGPSVPGSCSPDGIWWFATTPSIAWLQCNSGTFTTSNTAPPPPLPQLAAGVATFTFTPSGPGAFAITGSLSFSTIPDVLGGPGNGQQPCFGNGAGGQASLICGPGSPTTPGGFGFSATGTYSGTDFVGTWTIIPPLVDLVPDADVGIGIGTFGVFSSSPSPASTYRGSFSGLVHTDNPALPPAQPAAGAATITFTPSGQGTFAIAATLDFTTIPDVLGGPGNGHQVCSGTAAGGQASCDAKGFGLSGIGTYSSTDFVGTWTLQQTDPNTGRVANTGVGTFSTSGRGCQVNVQRLGQCRLFHTPPDPDPGTLPGWLSGTSALDQYAFHFPYKPAAKGNPGTICTLGCALTSLSMALNQAGMLQIPYCGPLTPVGCAGLTSNDPGSLNNFLKFPPPLSITPTLLFTPPSPPGLYEPGNNVSFDVATRWLASALKLPKPWYFDLSHEGEPGAFESSGSPCIGVACQTLDTYLCANKAVIVRVVGADRIFGNHFVLVVDNEGSDYLINDPANEAGTGSPRHTLLSQYTICDEFGCTALFSIVGVVKDPSGDVGGLDLATDTNAELLVVDSSARRTGFDAASGNDVKGIPNSTHYVEATDDEQTGAAPTEFSHVVDIFQPGRGNYQIIAAGLHLGTYVLVVRPFSQDGSAQPELSMSDIANVGSTSTFQVQYSSTPGAKSTVARVATFQTTLADISNSLQLGLMDNAGIANALLAKINAASDAAARGDSKTASNVLNAFKNQVSAQTGKHITGVAPEVLREDADSLLNQLP